MYEELKLYLKMNLDKPSLDFIFSQEENREFFAYIDENFPKDYLDKDENILEIKEAFKEYFERVGYILLSIKDRQIRLKIFPYTKKVEDSIYLDSLVKIIESNDELIEYDYKGMKNQILITDKLLNKIYAYLAEEKDEQINKKELVKYALRVAFELQERDIIINKKEHIFIKLIDNIKKHEVKSDEKESVLNRYNGISEDELEELHIGFFSNNENSKFFYIVAGIFVEKYFKEKKISNATYEKSVFAYIQAIIIEQLTSMYDDSAEFFKGFSGYIFRIHFREVFSHIAEFILVEISMSNSYMTEFLKYYSLNVIVVDGNKYRVPVLDAGNGLKWNVVSMLSIAKVYTKTKKIVKQLKEDLHTIDEEILELFIGELSPVEYQGLVIKSKNDITELINKEMKKLEKCYDTTKLSAGEKTQTNKDQEISEIRVLVAELREKKAVIEKKMVKQSVIKLYNDLEKEFDSMSMHLKREEKLLSQNSDSYQSIKNALILALTSKKQRV